MPSPSTFKLKPISELTEAELRDVLAAGVIGHLHFPMRVTDAFCPLPRTDIQDEKAKKAR